MSEIIGTAHVAGLNWSFMLPVSTVMCSVNGEGTRTPDELNSGMGPGFHWGVQPLSGMGQVGDWG